MAALKAISEKSSSQNSLGGGCLIAFGFAFFAAGCIAGYFTLILPLYQSYQSQSWIAHPAEITASRVDVSHDDDGTTYRPEVHFHYELDGQAFDGTKWSFSVWSASQSWAEAVIKRYPVGSQQTCYYNPNAPSEAVLDRSLNWVDFAGLFTLIFVIVGGGIMYAGICMLRTESAKRTKNVLTLNANRLAGHSNSIARLSNSENLPHSELGGSSSKSERELDANPDYDRNNALDDEVDDDDDDFDTGELFSDPPPWAGHEGPQRLQPGTSRMAIFVGVLVFALFWNGFSWILFINILQDEGWLSIPGIFISIFVTVGLGLLLFAFYAFLALFNPKVTIALSNAAALPGETVDVAWELEGRHQRIRELKLAWVGRESATYTRGTTTTTDKNEFARIPIASATDPEQIRFNSVEFTIPANAMHSFTAPRNNIEWTIEVHGIISWWPDLRESMAVYVKTQDIGATP